MEYRHRLRDRIDGFSVFFCHSCHCVLLLSRRNRILCPLSHIRARLLLVGSRLHGRLVDGERRKRAWKQGRKHRGRGRFARRRAVARSLFCNLFPLARPPYPHRDTVGIAGRFCPFPCCHRPKRGPKRIFDAADTRLRPFLTTESVWRGTHRPIRGGVRTTGSLLGQRSTPGSSHGTLAARFAANCEQQEACLANGLLRVPATGHSLPDSQQTANSSKPALPSVYSGSQPRDTHRPIRSKLRAAKKRRGGCYGICIFIFCIAMAGSG